MQPLPSQTPRHRSYRILLEAIVIGILLSLVVTGVLGLAVLTGGATSFESWALPTAIFGLSAAPYGAVGGLVIGLAILLANGRRRTVFFYASVTGVLYGMVAELLTWGHIQGMLPMLGAVAGAAIALVVKVPDR